MYFEYLEIGTNQSTQISSVISADSDVSDLLRSHVAKSFLFPDLANDLGEMGWELVAVVPSVTGYRYYFKRQIRGERMC